MNKANLEIDNICAISTPQGIGGVALIRISGNKAIEIVQSIFSKEINNEAGYSIHFGSIFENKNEIDQVLVTIFRNPHSFTGEDTVEITCHGSLFIQNKIIELLINNGARIAKAGEFSQRAFLNGKMDLSQTEAIADLIHSSSAAAHNIAMNQMKGGFSNELKSLREKLISFASLVELELDFAEEDVEFADRKQLNELVEKLVCHVNQLKNSFKYGNAIKNGVETVIVGRPNSGKSTLLNSLLNEDRALVSNIPGTTRDTIEEIININGIEFRLIDTAGVRDATDNIEKMGVERTIQKIKTSSILIYLYDAQKTKKEEVQKDIEILNQKEIPALIIANKIDLLNSDNDIQNNHIKLSAKEEKDAQILKNEIHQLFLEQKVDEQGVVISNLRHFEALEMASIELQKVKEGLENKLSGDFLAMDIRQVLFHIGSITGDISSDELLGNIFTNFCIGK
ncbi:MAG: tRNA uridine-5-carboxymethylaminomethyl(34) synthesis GTPase MnmE [Parvicellaceae bacterium]